MAFNIGAASDGLDKLILHGPVSEARSVFAVSIEANQCLGKSRMESDLCRRAPDSVLSYRSTGVLRQPGQVCFSIFDQANGPKCRKKWTMKDLSRAAFTAAGCMNRTGREGLNARQPKVIC